MGCDLWVFVVTLIAVTVGGSPGTKETNLQENMINKPHKLGTDLVMASVESVLNEVHLLRTQVSLLQRQNSRVYTMVKRQGRSCGNNKSSESTGNTITHKLIKRTFCCKCSVNIIKQFGRRLLYKNTIFFVI